jgi:hypothetical protein
MRRLKREIIEENKFVRKVRGLGWEAVKLTTAGPFGKKGFNDRLLIAPFGVQIFFEFKRKDERARILQSYRHRKLRRLGHKTHVVYSARQALKISWKEIQAKKVSIGLYRVRRRKARSRFLSSSRSREDHDHSDDLPHSKKARAHR